MPGAFLACSAILWSLVEMGVEVGASSIVPSSVPICPFAPSLDRVPWGGFPGFIGTMGSYDALPPFPIHFVSFDPRYLTPRLGALHGFAPSVLLARRADGQGYIHRFPFCGSPPGWEMTGPPRFLGNPRFVRAVLLDPARPLR